MWRPRCDATAPDDGTNFLTQGRRTDEAGQHSIGMQSDLQEPVLPARSCLFMSCHAADRRPLNRVPFECLSVLSQREAATLRASPRRPSRCSGDPSDPTLYAELRQRSTRRARRKLPGRDTPLARPVPAMPQRSIDVLYFGRWTEADHAWLIHLSRQEGFFCHFYVWTGLRATDCRAVRQRNAAMLRRARYVLVWAPAAWHQKWRVGIGQDHALSTRYREGAAAGAVLLGSRRAGPVRVRSGTGGFADIGKRTRMKAVFVAGAMAPTLPRKPGPFPCRRWKSAAIRSCGIS